MRTPIGDLEGEGGLLVPEPAARASSNGHGPEDVPGLDQLTSQPPEPAPTPAGNDASAQPDRSRSRHLPSIAPDPEPGQARSRFDVGAGVVLYNDRHADYLMVKDSESALLDYLATLVAKEYVLYNNPRAASEDLAEEMVRMVVRVRRYLPKRG